MSGIAQRPSVDRQRALDPRSGGRKPVALEQELDALDLRPRLIGLQRPLFNHPARPSSNERAYAHCGEVFPPAQLFAAKNMHQPLGLMLPSTILHMPGVEVVFPGMN